MPAQDPVAPAKKEEGVAVIDRACAILFAFRPGDNALTLAELAARTGLYKSTLLRLAGALMQHRLLLRLEDGRYQLGPATFALGALYQRSLNLGGILLPLMRELAIASGEGVSFYVRDNAVRVCLHRVDSQHMVRHHVREGDVLPLESGSGGRALLAFGGEPGEVYEQIRRDFYCVSVGERDRETAGMSMPVFGVQDTLRGVITLAGPSSRVDAAFVERNLSALFDCAARATDALGGNSRALREAQRARG
ncbi:IclR family transcriptional regulator [Paraburkholderia acidisoli]|uniref:Helix-turn-helix domain-containing protein n=1 Tax=Paraburkholderia acidisoli TaxID=2571748 RepID=A0A7Z2JEA5_9BURK|nr:IclR family transcriptional regulator [Paraburkholderia acidisoli]QGZ61461.1 helix-turn-helix domain-containing protein [Paraburkholderia acidisoli]